VRTKEDIEGEAAEMGPYANRRVDDTTRERSKDDLILEVLLDIRELMSSVKRIDEVLSIWIDIRDLLADTYKHVNPKVRHPVSAEPPKVKP
jgi:hypothetical protein